MMRKALFIGACLSFLLTSYFGVQAQVGGRLIGTETITTAVPFLMIGPDSRHGGMGEAGVAVTDDANAMHWNPSALAFIDKRMGFAMSYSPWLRALGIPDINLMYLSGYYNTGGSGVVGASLRYFSLGQIDFTDGLGQPIGSAKPNEFALDVAYALKISEVLSGAVSLRYFHSQLASNGNLTDGRPVNSVSGDISFQYKKDFRISGASDIPVQFTSGINISNIGPKVSYTAATAERDFIPTNLRIGYAFKFYMDDYNSITIAHDINKLMVPSEGGRSNIPYLTGIFGSFGDEPDGFVGELSELNTQVGMEYWYRDLFALRLGFFYETPEKGNRKFITLGAGIKYNVFGLDFSYLAPLAQNHPLQNTLRFTLSYDFDSAGNE
jgi:hypothetical protein